MCVCAIVAPLYIPWYLAILLAAFAAGFVPPIAIVVGLIFDLLYYPGNGLPYFTILGVLGAAIAFFVHRFVKTRIMS